MNVVHLSTYDVVGGACKAAYRLHRALLGLGYMSRLLVAKRFSDDPTVQDLFSGASVPSKIRWFLRAQKIRLDFLPYERMRSKESELFSDDRSKFGGAVVGNLPPCDVVNLHWIAGFVDYGCFFQSAAKAVPIVWRLADMNPFTGGCHYDEGCGRFAVGCGKCPQLGSKSDYDLSRRIWKRKFDLLNRLERSNLHIVAQSRWMAEQIKASPILRQFDTTVIANGVNTTKFTPRNKQFAREILQVPHDFKVLLFIADNVELKRKGFKLLIRALERLAKIRKIILVTVGNGRVTFPHDVRHLHVDAISDECFLSLIYSAADLYVIPSLQDNFPNTALESMSCGTPVVGFATGGLTDFIENEETGILVEVGNVGALTDAIGSAIENSKRLETMGDNCRSVITKRHSIESYAMRYARLYENMCMGTRG